MITVKEYLSKIAIQKGFFPSSINFTPEEADRFIDYMIDQSVFKDHVRFEKMAKSSKNVRAIGLGASNFLWPEAAFDSTKYLVTGTHNLITLTSKKARGAARVHDDDLEDNIEGEKFVDHLLKMIAKQINNELEYAYLMGVACPEGVTPKELTDIWNGWRYRILKQSNTVTGQATILDARSATDFALPNGYIAEQSTSAPYNWEFKFSKAIKKLPDKYKRMGLQNFRFFLNDQLVQDFIDALVSRSTVLGDQAILEGGQLKFGNIPIVPVPQMPVNLPVPITGGGDTTIAQNASAGQSYIIVSSTTGFQSGDYIWIHKNGLEYKEEVFKITSIGSGNRLNLDGTLIWDHAAADAESVTEVTLDGADCILTHKENFIVGIQRDIKMETERKASEESTYFFYSIRADVAIENLNAVVLIKNLKVR